MRQCGYGLVISLGIASALLLAGEANLQGVGLSLQQVSRNLCCFGSSWATVSADGEIVVFESNHREATGVETDLYLSEADGLPVLLTDNETVGEANRDYMLRGRTPLSRNGTAVVFEARFPGETSELADVYMLLVDSHELTPVSELGRDVHQFGDACLGSISSSSDQVVFVAEPPPSPRVENVESYVYLWDTRTELFLKLASIGGNFACGMDRYEDWAPQVVAGGEKVLFVSSENGLVSGDSNDHRDVFSFDVDSKQVELISRDRATGSAAGNSDQVSASDDGRFLSFRSTKNLIEASPDEGISQVYFWDQSTRNIRLVSQYQGIPGVQDSDLPMISSDGEHIAFRTFDAKLYFSRWWERRTDDAILVADTRTGSLVRQVVNRDQRMSNPGMPPGVETRIALSDRAKHIIFDSKQMLGGDTEFLQDVWLYDRSETQKILPRNLLLEQSGQLRRVNTTPDGKESLLGKNSGFPNVSSGGGLLTFVSEDNRLNGVVEDLLYSAVYGVSTGSGGMQLVGEVFDDSHDGLSLSPPAVSTDGRFIVFAGSSRHLGGVTLIDLQRDIAVDVCHGLSLDGADAKCSRPDISGDGGVVVFHLTASDLPAPPEESSVHAYIAQTNSLKRLDVSIEEPDSPGISMHPSITEDGMAVAFQSDRADLIEVDRNGRTDIFVFSMNEQTARRVSVSAEGEEAIGDSLLPVISKDGRYVVFLSNAPNLAPDFEGSSWAVFIKDLVSGSIEVADLGLRSPGATVNSFAPSVSETGRFVAFAAEVRPAGVGGRPIRQVYYLDRTTGILERISQDAHGNSGNAGSDGPIVRERSGEVLVSFVSESSNLVEGDRNFARDVFLYSEDRSLFPTLPATPSSSSTPEPVPSATVTPEVGPTMIYLPKLND
jgi:Tol biopolymer transport system component